jgi:hypothetical protein
MLTPEEFLTRAGTQYPMSANAPTGFNAQQLIYRRLGLDNRRETLFYKVLELPTLISDMSLDNFVSAIANSQHAPKGDDYEEIAVLDITVSKDSYIIIELPRGWMFDPTKDAVTLGSNANSANYGGLRYVRAPDHLPPNASANVITNCRLVYFSAVAQRGTDDNPYLQPLNFNIFMRNGLACIIDPDIRFPGNGTS